MRILMLTRGHLQPAPNAPEIGGSGRQCLKLSKALVEQGVDVTVVADRLSPRDPARKIVDGVRIDLINTGRPYVYQRGLKRLGAYVYLLSVLFYLFKHRNAYDVIHAHSARIPGFVSVLAGKWLKKKSVIKVMSSGAYNDILKFRQDETVVGAGKMADYLVNCDRVIALNDLARRELLGLGFRPEQIALIPNGVEVDEIEAKPGYGDGGALQMVYAGRLVAAKGLDTLLNAMHILIAQRGLTDCRLTVLGKGPQQPQLQALAGRLGVAPYVDFAGEVSDVGRHLRASDVFVLPSHAEGISNALLEAMAAGLPCVATDTAGNDVLIQHEHNGLLVRPEESGVALAGAIERLAHDRALRERLGRAARQSAESRFDIAATARRYIDLYAGLLAAPAATEFAVQGIVADEQ